MPSQSTPDDAAEKRAKNAAANRRWYEQNREAARLKSAAYKAANREKLLAYAATYREEHREEERERTRSYDLRHRYERREKSAAYYWTHPEERRVYLEQTKDRINALKRIRRQEVRAEMIAAYGGCCACCGEREHAFLTLDHVAGGGNAHRRQFGNNMGSSSDRIIRVLRSEGWPRDNFRLLCWNCQFGVQREGGCPHIASRLAV